MSAPRNAWATIRTTRHSSKGGPKVDERRWRVRVTPKRIDGPLCFFDRDGKQASRAGWYSSHQIVECTMDDGTVVVARQNEEVATMAEAKS